MEKSVALVVFVTVKIKKFKDVGMKQFYQGLIIEIDYVSKNDVLLISLDTPEYRDDIFGQELDGSSQINGGALK